MTTIALKDLRMASVRQGILLVCLVSFIWALMETIIQNIPGRYSLYQVVWVRYATHLLFLLLVLAPRHGIKLVYTRRLGLQLLRAIMMLIMPVSFILAVEHFSVGNILTIFWLAPLMILVLSVPVLKEGVSWHYWVLAGFGLVCIMVLTHPNRNMTGVGVLLSLCMGLSFSLYLVLTRLMRDENRITNLFYTAAGVLVPLSLRLPTFWKPVTLQSGLMMILVGLLGFLLLWLLEKALDMISVAVAAPFLYTQMFWMIVLRVLLKIM